MDHNEQNKFLSDPQQINSYSYARNNPLKYIDPNGKEVSVVGRSINFNVLGIDFKLPIPGVHTYLNITPDQPSQINNSNSAIPNTSNFTVSATNVNGTLISGVDGSADYGYKPGFFQKLFYSETPVTPPSGVSDSQFINNILNQANNYQNDTPYRTLGNQAGKNNGNSNNYVTNLLYGAGLSQDTITNYDPRGYTPGFGQLLPGNSQTTQLQHLLNQNLSLTQGY